jgi:hypothetical protein
MFIMLIVLPGIFLEGKRLPAHEALNLTAICDTVA